jgi:hypothetical protein
VRVLSWIHMMWFVADADMVCVSVLTDALPCLQVVITLELWVRCRASTLHLAAPHGHRLWFRAGGIALTREGCWDA